jgi:hypothetical protein
LGKNEARVTFLVKEAFQGVTQGATVLASPGIGDCCGLFQPDESYLVFISRNRDGRLSDVSLSSGTMPISRAAAVLRWLRSGNQKAWNGQLLGIVWDADTTFGPWRPLARARIMVSGNGSALTTTTDDLGVYQI